MKVAVLYNRESKNVINLFGQPNKEVYGLKAIKRVTDALKAGGHQVTSFEADKTLIDRLGNFMPSVVKGERPGMVFNLSYGVQGQARYTHVPGILEMVGVPYVGSGPLAHSLSLDKVVAKMLFVQHDLPTPKFAIVEEDGFEIPNIPFPVIVKPKNESTSFGLKVCNSEEELREGVANILKEFNQPVLVEQFIDGREFNVGIIGNDPCEALPPAEIVFGKDGPKIYTLEDKKKESGRTIGFECPAKLSPEISARAQEISKKAFKVLGCSDCARVDLRLDNEGNLYILEINSLPSLGEHGSYTQAAEESGLDFTALVNRLVDVATARYFGTPSPPDIAPPATKKDQTVFDFIVQRRDKMEDRLENWVSHQSYTDDPIGIDAAFKKLDRTFSQLKLKEVPQRETDQSYLRVWETKKGLEGGTLLIGNIDVPSNQSINTFYRADPEWLYGEAIARSRGPAVMLEYALRALKVANSLNSLKLGVLYYADEGMECRESAEAIKRIAATASNVLVLRPGLVPEKIVDSRRGYRKYRMIAESKPKPFGYIRNRVDPFLWTNSKLTEVLKLSDAKKRLTVGVIDQKTSTYAVSAPHRVDTTIQISYGDAKQIDEVEKKIEAILKKKPTLDFKFYKTADRAPMKSTSKNKALYKKMANIGSKYDVTIGSEGSALPSVAGLVPSGVPVLCGLGPVGKDLYSPNEAIKRITLVQRALLLSEFLLSTDPKAGS